MRLPALAAQVDAVPAGGDRGIPDIPDLVVTGVTLRGQESRPGDLFAALPGATAHGAVFAAEAIAGGAVAVLTDPAGAELLAAADVPVLVHPAPRTVLGALAAEVYGRPSAALTVIGVTGTSGKTTTTYLVEAGLRAAGRTAGLIGTVGVRIAGTDEASALTTPEAPALQALLAVMHERGVDTCVMEVSSHALELGRVDGVRFAAGGFTNLSRDHLDFHPTMADYFEAKARLFDPRSPLHAGTAVICIDDDAGRTMAARAQAPVTVSTIGPADWTVEAVTDLPDGSQEFTAVDPAGVHHRIGIRLPGRYNVANCLVALALLDVVGVAPEQAVPGLRDARAGWSRSTADRIFWRWSTTHTNRARCGPSWKPCAGRAVHDGSPSCSAPAETAIRASGSRWAPPRPNWPTWWWSPTTTRATRTPRPSGRPCSPARTPRQPARRWPRSATGARPSTTPWPGRSRGMWC